MRRWSAVEIAKLDSDIKVLRTMAEECHFAGDWFALFMAKACILGWGIRLRIERWRARDR